MLFTALMYRSAYTVLGGYITARLAPKNVMMHVVVLMVLGGIGGVAGAIGGWQLGNHWYPVALAVTGPAFVWLGGVIRMRKK
jgi:disulfide bond formation protein DsbB